MFDFTEEKLTDEQIMSIAKQDGLPPLRVAINANGYHHVQHLWGQPDASSIYKGEAVEILLTAIRTESIARRGVVGLQKSYDLIRKLKRFKGDNDGLMERIKDEMIPALEKANLVCLIGDKIYVHPAIIGESWHPNFKTYEGEHTSRLPYHLRYDEEEVEAAIKLYRKAKSLLNGK